jgi:thiamine pyridinylase
MRSTQKLRNKAILWPILLAVLALAGLAFRQSDCKLRILRVGIYPFVPESADIKLKIAQEFEKGHEDVRLEFADLGDYYNGGLLDALSAKKVDVAEVDTVFLQDLVQNKLIEAIPRDRLPSDTDFLSLASRAATFKGQLFGVPHWICGNFLFFRKSDPDAGRLSKVTKLYELEQILGQPTTEGAGTARRYARQEYPR